MKNKIVFIFLFTSATVFAQDNNYWTRQYGSISSVLGGAVVGSHNDNGSIYYNPATLSFTDSIKLSVSTGLYEGSYWKASNGIKQGEPLYSTSFTRFPIAIFPSLKLKKGYKIGLIYIPRLNGNFYMHDAQQNNVDVLQNKKPIPLYTSFDYRNHVDEWWYGLSLSKKLNEHSSIGAIPFVSYRTQNYSYVYGADAVLDSLNNKYLNTYVQKYVHYYSYKLILKGGYYYIAEKFSFGTAITIPTFAPLSSGYSNARVFLNGYSAADSSLSDQYFIADEQVDLKANHKYPNTLSLGCKIKTSRCVYYLSTETFFKINTYNVLNVKDNQIKLPTNTGFTSAEVIGVQTASRFFTNVAVGFQFKLMNNKTISSGFSTDFNSLPSNFKVTGTNINTSNWDIYHASVGFDANIKKIKISMGLRASYGLKKNNRQFADIPTANGSNLLYGNRQTNSTNSYGDMSILLGFNF